MRIHTLKINGFRRIKEAAVTFGDTTFLIGSNNCGKSSILRALKALLSVDKRLDPNDFYSTLDPDTNETKIDSGIVILEATFRNVPDEAKTWRGFKGRISEYDVETVEGEEPETGLSITYRKTYGVTSDVIVEMECKKRTLKDEFKTLDTPQKLIEAGIPEGLISDIFDKLDKKIKEDDPKLLDIDEMWEFSEEDSWEKNPGGIPGVVISKLPSFLLIPADSSDHEIHSAKGVLCTTLGELFEDVRNASENYAQAKSYLLELAKELNPSDTESEFGKMLVELNQIVGGVFPDSKLHATADLTGPNSLKPNFTIEMSSNIKTPVTHQGTGMIRSAVFGILRFRQKWLSERSDTQNRSIIIGFEEPELYLHPSAANQMRDTIYDLSRSNSQIVATSHSPQMIDLAKKPRQIINRFYLEEGNVSTVTFNVTQALQNLQADDKHYVKILLKIDDYLARVFFTKKVIIVEGDTEDIVIRESISRLSLDQKQRIRSNFEIIKARGKASIIGLSKYLVAMGIVPTIIHDRDEGTAGAEVFNQPIADAAGGGTVIQLRNCLEEVIGYPSPQSEKPFKAYKKTLEWGTNWNDIPSDWRTILRQVFGGFVPEDPA